MTKIPRHAMFRANGATGNIVTNNMDMQSEIYAKIINIEDTNCRKIIYVSDKKL